MVVLVVRVIVYCTNMIRVTGDQKLIYRSSKSEIIDYSFGVA